MERWKRARTSLYTIRIKSGLTQVELARRAGVNHTTIVHAETGKKQPQLSTLLKIVEVLDGELSKQGHRVTLDNLQDIVINDTYYNNAQNNGVYLLRVKSGLTQKELAKRAGVTTVTVYQAETGRVRPYTATLLKLIQVLNEELTNQVNWITTNDLSPNDYSYGLSNPCQQLDSSISQSQRLRIPLLRSNRFESSHIRKYRVTVSRRRTKEAR